MPNRARLKPSARVTGPGSGTPARDEQSPHEAGSAPSGTSPPQTATSAASGSNATLATAAPATTRLADGAAASSDHAAIGASQRKDCRVRIAAAIAAQPTANVPR